MGHPLWSPYHPTTCQVDPMTSKTPTPDLVDSGHLDREEDLCFPRLPLSPKSKALIESMWHVQYLYFQCRSHPQILWKEHGIHFILLGSCDPSFHKFNWLIHVYPRGPYCPEGVLPRANIFSLGSTPQSNKIGSREYSLRSKIWVQGLIKNV